MRAPLLLIPLPLLDGVDAEKARLVARRLRFPPLTNSLSGWAECAPHAIAAVDTGDLRRLYR